MYVAHGTLLNVTWQLGWEVSWGKMDIYIYIYVWLSSFAVHLKLSSHCLLTGYTPLQIKSLITSKHMISNSFLGRNGKLHKFRYHIQIIIKVRQTEDIIYFIH